MLKETFYNRDCNRIIICAMLVLYSIFSNIFIYAEKFDYAPTTNVIIPPSPEVSDIIKYSKFDNVNNEGLPTIKFDLFTITEGDISLPISIIYQSGGLHIDEIEGNAGIGWSVSVGGCVSRTIYGGPDEYTKGERGFHGLFHLTEDEKAFRIKLKAKKADYDPIDTHRYMDFRSWQTKLGLSYFENKCDLANDIFHITGFGVNATFAYNDNHRLIKSTDSPIRIEPSSIISSYPSEFTVKHINGLKYRYGEEEKTKYVQYIGAPFTDLYGDTVLYTSSWHISNISDLLGNRVDFSYENTLSQIVRLSKFEKVTQMTNPNFECFNSNPIYTQPTETTYYPKTLRKITTSGNVFIFDYETDSIQYYRKKRIKSITIQSKNSEILSKYTFDYKRISPTNGILWNFLDKIRLNGEVVYSFDYNNDINVKQDNTSSAIDFGGFYNGKDNGLIVPSYSTYVGGCADRSVDPALCLLGSLKSINYPTGGKTIFDWESNEYAYVGKVPINHRINNPVTKIIETDTIRMCIDDSVKKLSIKGYKVQSGQEIFIDLSKYLLFNPDNLLGTDYYYEHSDNVDEYTEGVLPDYPHLTVRNAVTNKLLYVYYLDYKTIELKNNNNPIYVPLGAGTYNFELVNPMSIDKAEDVLYKEFRYADSAGGRIIITRNKYLNNEQDINKDYWCGLRLRRITSSPSDDEQPIIKDFFYTKAFDPRYSNGIVQMLPSFHNTYYFAGPSISIGAGEDGGEVVTIGSCAFPQTPIGSISRVEYPSITTRLSLPNRYEPSGYLNDYIEEYKYTTSVDDLANDYSITEFLNCQPVASRMYVSKDYRRGFLKSKQVGGRFNSSDITEYNYNILEPEFCDTLTTEPFIVCDFTHCAVSTDCGRDYGIGKYIIIPYTKNIQSEIIKKGNGFNQKVNYEYFYSDYTENFDSGLVKKITCENSEGDTESTYFTYAFVNGVITDKVETIVKLCNGEVIDAQRNEYDLGTGLLIKTYSLSEDYSNLNDVIPVNKYASGKALAAISSPEFEYKYNQKGNIIEIKYRGSVIASYIWGYFGQYPIIEIKNKATDEIFSFVKSLGYDVNNVINGSLYSKKDIESLSKVIRNKYANSDVSTFTYHWLVGMATATDSRGVNIYYSYDKSGRLSIIRNMNNSIIKKYEYKYKNNQ